MTSPRRRKGLLGVVSVLDADLESVRTVTKVVKMSPGNLLEITPADLLDTLSDHSGLSGTVHQ